MSHAVLRDARLYQQLLEIDLDLAAGVHASGCGCGGALHRADYPRKSRGAPCPLPDEYGRRFSFCCARHGCRSRATPPSVRFLGRRVYLAVVVVLVSAMAQGLTPWRAAKLDEALGVDRRTFARWREWWLESFPSTPTWRTGRGRFMPPVDEGELPRSMLERFVAADPFGRLTAMLRFLSPCSAEHSRSLMGA